MNTLTKLRKDNKGFTLIEIVIVIVIIAILAAVLVPNLLKWVSNSKIKTTIADADAVKTSIIAEIADSTANDVSITATTYATLPEKNKKAVQDSVSKSLSNAVIFWTYDASDPAKVASFAFTNGGFSAVWVAATGRWEADKNPTGNGTSSDTVVSGLLTKAAATGTASSGT